MTEKGDKMEDLAELVRRAQQADAAAFSTVVERFQDMAVGYAYSILGDFALAEDAAQEAFVQAFRDIAKVREPLAFPGWLRRLVSTQCGRVLRKGRPRAVALSEAVPCEWDGPEPPVAAEQQEIREQVLAALRALPEQERSATELFYLGGRSLAEVGRATGVPVSTVKNRLHSARARLRNTMAALARELGLPTVAADERGRAMESPTIYGVGDRIGQYIIRQVLGIGGMGAVYRVEHPILKREAALKIAAQRQETLTHLLQREAQVLARFKHPNILAVYDAGEHDGRAFLVMELLAGQTLDKVADGGVSPAALLAIMAKVGEALAYLHERGVIHAEVKPINIIVQPSQEPVLVDLGLCVTADGGLETPRGTTIGTPAYMSPEQARGETATLTAAADVWGFGATLFRVIAGRTIYGGDTVKEMLSQVCSPEPVDLAPLTGKASAEVLEVVAKCLRKDPSQRYPSGRELEEAMRALVRQG